MTEATAPSSSDDLENVLRQVLRMVDITRDIERNKDDAAWNAADKTIHYVIDENIFELFVSPSTRGEIAATFHGGSWLTSATSRPSDWAAITAQSALITSEYLLSGQLPGQREPQLYMTEWHMWELRQRVEQMVQDFRERTPPRQSRRKPNVADQPFLLEDLRRFHEQGGRWTPALIDRFVITRTAAHELARDPFYEPLEQLRRIVSPPLRDRILPLTDRFRVPPSSFGTLAANARAWMKRLEDETSRPGRRGPRRARGSLASDARALALVSWAAQTCDRDTERVVLVTGDHIVFDAYRRWHASLDPRKAEYMEPFALRRAVQYTPIFNMNDGIGDISDATDLFERSREAVEVALLPFNLATMGAKGAYLDAVLRSRELLALKLVDAVALTEDNSISYFKSRLDQHWIDESRSSLEGLTRLWQQTERAAIGSMYDSVQPRFNEQQNRAISDDAAGAGEALGPALSAYVNELLDRIVVDSVELWTPLASKFVDAVVEAASDAPSPRARPPLLLRLAASGRPTSSALAELMTSLSNGRALAKNLLRSTPELTEQPEILFAIAAVLALALGAWTQAERFADLAERSTQVAERAQRRSATDQWEFTYLRAVAIRFRIAELAPVRNESMQVEIERRADEATRRLSACIAHHDRPGDNLHQPLRAIRAHSERAALNLFYFGNCHLTGDLALRRRLAEAGKVLKALDAAEADLVRCFELETDALKQDQSQDDRRSFLKRLERQFVSNAAACALARAVFMNDHGSVFMNSSFAGRIAAFYDRVGPELPPIVQFELLAYLHLTGLRQLTGLAGVDAIQDRERTARSLTLDGVLFNAFRNWLKDDIDRRGSAAH